jgi:hypothetical protein
MIGNIDRSRLKRALRYLKTLDETHHKAFVCHTISLNSYVQLQLSRTTLSFYSLILTRVSDFCVLLYHNFDQDTPEEPCIDLLENCLKDNGPKTKCHICTKVSAENGYCDLCSIMMTTVEEVCPICIDEARKEAVWVTTECKHVYHHECLGKVVDRKCPMCRKVLDRVKII